MSLYKWDGRPRRKTDFEKDGSAKIEVIMARIDERVNTLIKNGIDANLEALKTRQMFLEHVKEDDGRFKEIEKIIWRTGGIVTGGLTVVFTLIDLFLKK